MLPNLKRSLLNANVVFLNPGFFQIGSYLCRI